ncbi:sodium-dependent nutrient amino acid transporter 1-like isoform X1 [Trichogramma pretiosum]|uniref:sodium-dependent nutrient amino acid transporter 1-like isoform X1 n=1 Tax=Trichogramma pretiosum TaxID=7493 RepID=UPI0006C97DB3|nr:sodium-dependent nutrient amino acid transporter 1-like isoform X1 [Trichogramma pretiosum]
MEQTINSGGLVNHGFTNNDGHGSSRSSISQPDSTKIPIETKTITENTSTKSEQQQNERAQWGNDREFLLSCISMSIGLGNVWRFPATAYANGGGAFLIPYIIILTVVGRPYYLLEMVLGQFSSKSTIKIWDMVPAFRGIGFVQFFILVALSSYYCSLMALTLFYLINSFQAELPWSKCRPEWGSNCLDSLRRSLNATAAYPTNVTQYSSAELYFFKEVLREKDNIDDGIGMPDWRLALCLAASWLVVFLVVVRGIKSSGKAAYFLASFPYIVMLGLLIRAVTLEGAGEGILYFVRPQWDKLKDPSVWYAAVSQCFFSLTICFGAIVMFSSHNRFEHNVYRDAQIVTTLDMFTSFFSGLIIFGILGNLAHELNTDIDRVVRGGTGLAFISYPDAIAKFTWMPQFFAVIFFVMLFVLGIGSAAGLASSVIAIIHDYKPHWKMIHVSSGVVISEFLIGLIYVTPGGQFMVTFVDYYITSFVAFVPAIFILIGVCYVYGLNNFLDDMEFMLKRRLGWYWRFCWYFLTPAIITGVFIYSVVNLKLLTYNGILYPDFAYVIGWILFSFALLQIPLWLVVSVIKKRHEFSFPEILKRTFDSSKNWGPDMSEIKIRWFEFRRDKKKTRSG